MQNSYPDIPVPKIENDLFDVKIYVDSLAQFISECDTPMTIAIQGDWGSGKTSMMNMIREKLGDRVITAWFNTWQFSQFGMSSQLSYSFLSYLTNQICSSDNNQELLKKIKKITFGFARLAAKIAVENTAGGVAADAMDKLSDEGFNYADEIISVKEKFEQGVQDKLTQANKGKDIVQKDRVVVFVDDLDRLPPEIAVELLEVLKLFVDVEKCVFVLAIDYAVVTQGIRKKYGDIMTEDKGKSFFDKIIQLPFKMPVGLYNLDNYVKRTLADFKINLDDDEKELDIYKGLFLRSIGQNPRTLKRLFNSFRLIKIIILANKGSEDKDTSRILFGILCMQMEYEDLYNYLISNRNNLNEELLLITTTQDLKDRLRLLSTRTPSDIETANMLSFWMIFLEAMQLDNDSVLSGEEIENFSRILGFSSITAAHASGEHEKENNKARYEIRDVTKQLLSSANQICEGAFKLYQSNAEDRACIYQYYQVNDLKNEWGVYVDNKDGEYTLSIYVQNKQKSYRDKFMSHVKTCFPDFACKEDAADPAKVWLLDVKTGATNKSTLTAEEIGVLCFGQIEDSLKKIAKIVGYVRTGG